MHRRLFHVSMLCFLACFWLPGIAHAQDTPEETYRPAYRAEQSLYFRGRVGLNTYGGDRDSNPDNEIQAYIERIGFSFGTELGYHFSHRFDLGLAHISGRYPRIDENTEADGTPYPEPFFTMLDPDETSEWRHSLSLIGRVNLLTRRRVTPYLHGGASIGLGRINGSLETGVGPIVGLGFDVAVSDQFGLFIDFLSGYYWGDDKMDAADPDAFGDVEEDVSQFDALNFYNFGLRYTFKSPFVPVTVACAGPQTLLPNESGTFTATINEDATRPVDVTWDFGDGEMGSGMLATHAYTSAGTYTARVTASNSRSMDTAECPVRVLAPARILSVTADPTTVDVCEPLTPVNFDASVEGEQPLQYAWDFGDGTTSTEADPTHTFSAPGTYTVTLRLSNTAGSDTRSLTITVEECELDYCQDITEMNSVFFDRNASVLTPQAIEALRENLQILQDCPAICVEVVGYASRDERNPQQLSEDRARAVEQFYIDGGIDTGRITIRGEGAAGQTTKKGGAPQFRRADTLPGPCVMDQ